MAKIIELNVMRERKGPITFAKACHQFLMLPDEPMSSMMRGMKALTQQDKEDLVRYFAAEGLTVELNQPLLPPAA